MSEANVVETERKVRRPKKRVADFYAQALSEAEQVDFAAAHEIEGIDEEIALMRTKLMQALKHKQPPELEAEQAAEPDGQQSTEFELMLKGIEILGRLVSRRYRLPARSAEDLAAAMRASLAAAGLTRKAAPKPAAKARTEAGHE